MQKFTKNLQESEKTLNLNEMCKLNSKDSGEMMQSKRNAVQSAQEKSKSKYVKLGLALDFRFSLKSIVRIAQEHIGSFAAQTAFGVWLILTVRCSVSIL